MAETPRILPPLFASLTLGLAPFVPQPHVLEKLRMIAAGGAGMKPIDVFDLALHGAPWVWLAWTLVAMARPAAAAGGADTPKA